MTGFYRLWSSAARQAAQMFFNMVAKEAKL